MEGITKAIIANTASATMEMLRGATCLYPFRWVRGEEVCAAVYPHPGFLFTLNYAFTHYVALLLIAWSIPPVCQKLRELLGFPEDRGAWLRLFWLVLLFLVTAYGTAVSHGMKTVLRSPSSVGSVCSRPASKWRTRARSPSGPGARQ